MNPTNLPNQYWEEAINTEMFLSNLSPTHLRNGKSPQFLWSNIFPNLTGLQTFGCQSVIHNLKIQQDWKLSSPGQEGILLGFENDGTAYRILRLDDLKVKTQREENSLSDPEDSLDIARYQETNNENINGSDRSNEGQTNQFPNESSCDSPVECSDHLNNETNSHSH
ncbi:hypothetical protein O181_094446 [Austropuccinia psidii MF-1]|uniref:Retrovirus-related Pol polyprotein from transposon TNT 1-94 n=1 Tax=Austropuccinia psidii MF-1 TaxID=1389203 RepID=A0A9Q3J3H6_9BASI|nr:hypothetical protein [Austropuccinia psidii MF-1]